MMGWKLTQMTEDDEGLHDDTQRLWKRRDELEAQRDEAQAMLGKCTEELYAMEMYRDEFRDKFFRQAELTEEARQWAIRMKRERDEARANQVKGRCGECAKYFQGVVAPVCNITALYRDTDDYCSRWEAK